MTYVVPQIAIEKHTAEFAESGDYKHHRSFRLQHASGVSVVRHSGDDDGQEYKLDSNRIFNMD